MREERSDKPIWILRILIDGNSLICFEIYRQEAWFEGGFDVLSKQGFGFLRVILEGSGGKIRRRRSCLFAGASQDLVLRS